jgi:hypothetical protein
VTRTKRALCGAKGIVVTAVVLVPVATFGAVVQLVLSFATWTRKLRGNSVGVAVASRRIAANVCCDPMSTWNHCPLACAALPRQRVIALPSIALPTGEPLPVADALATQPVRDSADSAESRCSI